MCSVLFAVDKASRVHFHAVGVLPIHWFHVYSTFLWQVVFCELVCHWQVVYLVSCVAVIKLIKVYWRVHDVIAVMLNEAKISRPRPGPWGQGQDWGQGFEVKAEAKANFLRSRPKLRPKIVTNKKYQMMIDVQLNLHNHDLYNTLSFLILSHTVTVTVFYHLSVYPQHCVMSCSRQTDWSVSSWLLVHLLQTEARPNVWGRGQSSETEAFWPWCHSGLEDLTSLHHRM